MRNKPKTEVLKKHPDARCIQSDDRRWFVFTSSVRVIGFGPTAFIAWFDAHRNTITETA